MYIVPINRAAATNQSKSLAFILLLPHYHRTYSRGPRCFCIAENNRFVIVSTSSIDSLLISFVCNVNTLSFSSDSILFSSFLRPQTGQRFKPVAFLSLFTWYHICLSMLFVMFLGCHLCCRSSFFTF